MRESTTRSRESPPSDGGAPVRIFQEVRDFLLMEEERVNAFHCKALALAGAARSRHLVSSLWMRFRNASGVENTGSSPCDLSARATSSELMASRMARLSRATAADGLPAGITVAQTLLERRDVDLVDRDIVDLEQGRQQARRGVGLTGSELAPDQVAQLSPSSG